MVVNVTSEADKDTRFTPTWQAEAFLLLRDIASYGSCFCKPDEFKCLKCRAQELVQEVRKDIK